MKVFCAAVTALGVFALGWILLLLAWEGLTALSPRIFTEVTPGPGSEGGGLANAIVGSIILTFLGIAAATPIGVLAGTYLAEYGKSSQLANAIRFINDILLSAPSILIGLFVYTLIVWPFGGYSGWAGAVALAIIATPVIVRTTEDMLRLVPNTLREAGAALGAPPAQVTMQDQLARRQGGHRDRHSPRHGAHRRRDRAASVHRAEQQLLVQCLAPRRRLEPAGHDLPVRALALHELAAARLGGRAPDHGGHSGAVHRCAPAGEKGDAMTSLAAMAEPSAAKADLSARVRIACRNLDFFYGEFQALKNINLDFFDRQVTALIGPSGCGKSTLLRCFNRIYSLYPEQRATGEIVLDGRNVLSNSIDVNELRSRIGMVFQKPTPFPMSIYDNVAFGLRLYEKLSRAEVEERVEGALRKAALWDEVKDKLRQSGMGLSGGQQQRLCIARAIAQRPEVVLFDEPTSALDPISTGKIEELIEQLRSEFTIVIVTHNMQQAARISQFTAFMYLGELIEFDETARLFMNPSKKQTLDYVTGRFG